MKKENKILYTATIYGSIPDGWTVMDGALTAPVGYVWIHNGKSRFGGEHKQGLYKLTDNHRVPHENESVVVESHVEPVEAIDTDGAKEDMNFMKGDIVKVENAYTKRHNGLYVVTNVICNGRYYLHKVNKSGELSISNYSTCMWPLAYYSYNRGRNAAAKEWDSEHATISSATVKDMGGVIEYFRKQALECLERANNCKRLYGDNSTEASDNMSAFESYRATVERLGGTIDKEQGFAQEKQDTAQEGSRTRSIKFYYNGIKLNRSRELIKCHYSIDNRRDGQECVTIYARDYGTVLPRDLFDVENNSDSYQDYFDTDGADIFPSHPLYPYARAAALSAELKGREKHVAYLERNISVSRCADMYRKELAEYTARMDKYTAELSTLPKVQPTEKDLEAVHAMRLEQENQRKEEEQEKRQAEREKVLTERAEGRRYIKSVSDEYPIKDGEPVVTIEWSESPAFYDGMRLSVPAAEIVLNHFDEQRHNENVNNGKGGYDKTKFVIEYTNESGEPSTYEGRYDLGDNDGGMIAHIRQFAESKRKPGHFHDEEGAKQISTLADMLESYINPARIVSVSLAPWVEQKLEEVKETAEREKENLFDMVEMLTDEQLIMGVYASKDLTVARFFLQQLANRDQKKALEVFRSWRSGEPMDI